jgi:hypothetical protein
MFTRLRDSSFETMGRLNCKSERFAAARQGGQCPWSCPLFVTGRRPLRSKTFVLPSWLYQCGPYIRSVNRAAGPSVCDLSNHAFGVCLGSPGILSNMMRVSF